jgi:hypothetical protein
MEVAQLPGHAQVPITFVYSWLTKKTQHFKYFFSKFYSSVTPTHSHFNVLSKYKHHNKQEILQLYCKNLYPGIKSTVRYTESIEDK